MQWAVWVRSSQWNRRAPVAQVRQTFESMGFRLRDQKFNYYNPTRHSRFVVSQNREGAITLWTLAWLDHWPNCTVEIKEYEH